MLFDGAKTAISAKLTLRPTVSRDVRQAGIVVTCYSTINILAAKLLSATVVSVSKMCILRQRDLT
jgi:hypothetical protein